MINFLSSTRLGLWATSPAHIQTKRLYSLGNTQLTLRETVLSTGCPFRVAGA